MRLSFLIVIFLAVILTQQTNFMRSQHAATSSHLIFENSWAGTSDSACDNACRARSLTVCGRISKECCKQGCSYKWFGTNQYCKNAVTDLQCSVVGSISGGSYWTGTTCDAKCQRAGGQVCGKTNKECCETGCDVGTFIDTCQDKKSKAVNCTSV